MALSVPPKPPAPLEDPPDLAALEALIEEARQRAWRRRQRYAAALLLVVAGLAAYAGFAHGRGQGARSAGKPFRSGAVGARGLAKNGPLTILTTTAGNEGVATVETVGPGRPKIVWRCPNDSWCGDPVSHAWAPDGKRLAVTLNEIARTDYYPRGLHVIDLRSRRDVLVPPLRVGCWPLTDLDWSPDGTMLAYRCSLWPSGPHALDGRIDVLVLNGLGDRTVPTHGPAFWPTWAPGDRRIAYSTALHLKDQPAVYAVNLDGSQRRLLARDGTAPAWSPDGSRIAYESACGVRLVTPTGREITPRRGTGICTAIGPVGPPAWSPDGAKIAVETSHGIYVLDADGTHLRLISRRTSSVPYPIQARRPSWRPIS